MKIIISPAKKMKTQVQNGTQYPRLLKQTQMLYQQLLSLTASEIASCMKCNEKIAQQTIKQFHDMHFEDNLTPALFAYDGIQYRTMEPSTLSQESIAYLENHLFILSGFYGILKPLDGICEYRLEMKTKLVKGAITNLLNYWGNQCTHICYEENDVVVNLASKEYSRCIERNVDPSKRFITIHFVNEKLKSNSTEVKQARGAMVRYMAINQIENVEKIKEFKELGYQFSKSHSSENEWIFVRKMI